MTDTNPDLPAITQRATVTLDDGRTYSGTVRHLDVGRDTIVGMAPGPTTLELTLVVEERGTVAAANPDLPAIEARLRAVIRLAAAIGAPSDLYLANAPADLAALVERVRGLEAENAALRDEQAALSSEVAALSGRLRAALRRTP